MANNLKTGFAGRAKLWIFAAAIIGALLLALSSPAFAAASAAQDAAPASSNHEFGIDQKTHLRGAEKQHDDSVHQIPYQKKDYWNEYEHQIPYQKKDYGNEYNRRLDAEDPVQQALYQKKDYWDTSKRRLDAEDSMNGTQTEGEKQHDKFSTKVEEQDKKGAEKQHDDSVHQMPYQKKDYWNEYEHQIPFLYNRRLDAEDPVQQVLYQHDDSPYHYNRRLDEDKKGAEKQHDDSPYHYNRRLDAEDWLNRAETEDWLNRAETEDKKQHDKISKKLDEQDKKNKNRVNDWINNNTSFTGHDGQREAVKGGTDDAAHDVEERKEDSKSFADKFREMQGGNPEAFVEKFKDLGKELKWSFETKDPNFEKKANELFEEMKKHWGKVKDVVKKIGEEGRS